MNFSVQTRNPSINKNEVLVIVLNYKGQEVLLPCLASVFQELGPMDQCLVIDNGGESALLESIQREFPELRILSSQTNLGFAKGINVGLRLAEEEGFKAVWLLNNDAVVEPGALARLKEAASAHSGPHLFSPLILTSEKKVWFAGGKINFWRMRTEHIQKAPVTGKLFETGFLTGCALFMPQATLKQVGLLDERYFLYYEDAEYSLRTKSLGGKLWIVPEAVVVHREASGTNPEKTYWLVRSGVEFFRRHTPPTFFLWVKMYLWLRQCKNKLDLIFSGSLSVGRHGPLAHTIKRAYTDASNE